MHIFRKLAKPISSLFLPVFLIVGLWLPSAQAGMVGTERLIERSAGDKRDVLNGYLQRQEVRQGLLEYGVDPAQVDSRVAALSDREVDTLWGKIDTLPAGGSGAGVLFVLLALWALLKLMDFPDFLSADFYTEEQPETQIPPKQADEKK